MFKKTKLPKAVLKKILRYTILKKLITSILHNIKQDYVFLFDEKSYSSLYFCRLATMSSNFVPLNIKKTYIKANAPIFFFATPTILEKSSFSGENFNNVLYADKAYFDRDKYYRTTFGSSQLNKVLNIDPKRFQKLKINISDKNRSGNHILLCPQSEIFHQAVGVPQNEWLNLITAEIRKYSDRPIEIKLKNGKKPEKSFRESLFDCHSVVVMSSIAGVQATLQNVPCFATDINSSSFMLGSGPLSDIENPSIPDSRYELWCNLANNQWTIPEIINGKMFSDLRTYYPELKKYKF